MIYLNEGNGTDFVGGSTNFVSSVSRQRIISEVVPECGMVLVFDHRLNHEGDKLLSGTKYAIRIRMSCTLLLMKFFLRKDKH